MIQLKIQILGMGCPKCRQLAERAAEAAARLGLDFEIEKVTELAAITAMGAMITPALAVDGVLKLQGSVPTVEQLEEMLN
ncbi:TM0996/MTH895 family glutaredoxin-like protein [Candidatus Fermentibacterales bacterium]|nr:TM0996/MTH895 family glutaredoxin-like protein [Candidatus Fermentibacterales bacterium]